MTEREINYLIVLAIIVFGIGGPYLWTLWRDHKRNTKQP